MLVFFSKRAHIARIMGPTLGPPEFCRPTDGPHVGPVNLAIWEAPDRITTYLESKPPACREPNNGICQEWHWCDIHVHSATSYIPRRMPCLPPHIDPKAGQVDRSGEKEYTFSLF